MKNLIFSFLILLAFNSFAQKNKQQKLKLAYALSASGQHATAIKEYNSILENEPTCIKTLLQRGETFQQVGRYEEAVEDFERVLSIDYKNAKAYYCLGKEKQRNQDFRGAVQNYEKALRFRHFDNDLFYMMAKAKISLGDNVGAIHDLDFILDQEYDNVPALLQRGIALQNLKLYKEAEIFLSKAIKFDQNCPTAYSYRGYGRVELCKNNDAVEDFNKAIVLGETSEEVLYYRGLARYKLGDHDGALDDLVKSKRQGYLEAVNTLSVIGDFDYLEAKSR